MGFFDKINEGLHRSRTRLKEQMNILLDRGPDVDDDFWDDLEETLILADIGAAAADSIIEELRDQAKRKALPDAYAVFDMLTDQMAATFTEAETDIFEENPYPYSMDWNIWHLSHEGDDLENPANAPKDMVYMVTKTPEQAPDAPEYVKIDFEQGVPVAVNGQKLGAVELITALNEIGARNGVGIVDIVENRLVGMKSRGIYENPGGAIIMYAHRELEYLCLDRDTYHYKENVANKFAELVYDGKWFSPLREALSAFVDETQKTVTGQVTLKLYKGNIISAGSTSPYSLYNEEFVTFGEDDVYDQTDAEGFINLFGLPLKMRALMKQHVEKQGK